MKQRHPSMILFGLTMTLITFLILIFLLQGTVGLAAPAAPDPVTWTQLSTITNDLDVPSSSTQQTASLVLDIDKDGLMDFVIGARQSPGPSMVWYKQVENGWDRKIIDSSVLEIEAGGAYYDIDSDGDLDIVMGGDYQSNQVWWWENPYPDYSSEWTRRLIKDGGQNVHHDQIFLDFDQDSQAELIFWNQKDKKLLMAEIPADPKNSGTWSTTTLYSWSDDNFREGLTAADIDLDGNKDIIGGGRWFKYNGSGADVEVIDSALEKGRAVAAQLIPGGRPEVVFSMGEEVGPMKWYEFENNSWVAHDLLSSNPDHVHSLDIGDVNLDGFLDIFAAEMRLNGGNSDAKMWIFYGDGSGNFTTDVISTGIGNHESRLVNLDYDCDLDILGKPYNWDTPRLDIWINESYCYPALDQWDRFVIDNDKPWRAVFAYPADINKDGKEDIVTGGWWYENPGTPDGSWTRHLIGDPLNNAAVIYDFDGDSHMDILGTEGIGSSPNADIVWAKNDGSGNFTIYQNIAPAEGDFLQGAVVVESDGNKLEVALSWHASNNGVQMLTVPSDPTNDTWPWREINSVSQFEDLSADDIDHDGDIDLLLGTKWLRNEASDRGVWAYNGHRYRLPVNVDGSGVTVQDKIVELSINFSDHLNTLGSNDDFELDSLRLVEVDSSGSVTNLQVPFQFDPDPSYDPANNAQGTLVWLANGGTAANATRFYQVYFDTAGKGPFSPIPVAPLVITTSSEVDEGQDSLKIENQLSTFFYHTAGGGFSSLLDYEANDWINHSSAAGSAGDFRGIPNLVHPNDGGFFHPGRDTAATTLINEGPLKATFQSTADNGAWRTEWSIYPTYAQLTVLDAPGNYWFLYEGTPGGGIDLDGSDLVIRGDGTQSDITAPWTGDLTPEWVGFSDTSLSRTLYLAHNEDDTIVDSYYLMENNMTVFGFGRDGNTRALTTVPNKFTLGLVDQTLHSAIEERVQIDTAQLSAASAAPQAKYPHPSGPWTAFTLHDSNEEPDRNRLADINMDGRLDSVVGFETSDPIGLVAWYEQPVDPTGAWTEHVIDTGVGAFSMDVADADNDGDFDVIAGQHHPQQTSNLKLFVYENTDGDGSAWTRHTVYTGDEHHDGTQTFDVDNDGILDILSIGWTHSRVLVYHNTSPWVGYAGIPASQEIDLAAGWNLVSSHISQEDMSMENVLADIEQDLIIVKNLQGEVYWPGPYDVNNIGDWNYEEGYLIRMANPATLTMQGFLVKPGSTPLNLNAGWNMIPYFPQSPLPISQALAGIDNDILILKDGFGRIYWPQFNINQIGDMKPGEGYINI